MSKYIPIVFGEPKSINSEIIVKAWKKSGKLKTKIFVIGNYLIFKNQLKKYKIKIKLNKINKFEDINNKKDSLNIIDIPNGNRFVLNCIDYAHKLSITNKIKGWINAPINKKIFKFKYLGLTEYLAFKNKLSNSEVMMIYNKNFAVVPITTHVSIKDVTKKINTKIIINKVLSLNKNYLKYFRRKPKIAILGLNPHNSEGKKNSIENKIIKPAKEFLTKKKINITGPFPADTVFINNKINYDVIIGMYHDQVLAPFKAINGFDAINITLGLKYIRISPDHGVGENIIGMNQANSSSLLLSIKYLNKLVK
jgi:4-hydroxy-L-threonine phosphate dehydrogenase PdxA|tara:strand:- start:214 stop:1140 length:927 start_codon:yes stop_codon:yes gene_type:complete